MQLLYAVEFEVRSASADENGAYGAALSSLTDWLDRHSEEGFRVDRFSTDGRAELRENHGSPREALWDRLDTGTSRALRVHVWDHPSSDVSLETRVTIGLLAGAVTVRVSMGQRSSSGWLSPTRPAQLHQPGVVGNLVNNELITLRVNGQIQDGRFLQVRSEPEVRTLAASILTSTRLPVLLLHTRSLPARDSAWAVATKLVGLVRVVTLDLAASRLLEGLAPGFAPPLAGGRLIWSDPKAATVVVPADVVNGTDKDAIRGELMGLLAPVSVLVRGRDIAYTAVRRDVTAQREAAARALAEQAADRGDSAAQVEALEVALQAMSVDVHTWQELAQEQQDRADRYQEEAGRVPALAAQVESLKYALSQAGASSPSPVDESDPLLDAPLLVTGDGKSAENLALHLEDVSGGRLVFTPRAAKVWKKSGYPHPVEMTESTIKLAQVAIRLYDGHEHTIPHLDTWINEEFGLKVALQDDTIQKSPGIRWFQFEGDTLDRTPHVKVRDHTSPNQVGRIHFALNPKRGRIVVDHIGLKLY